YEGLADSKYRPCPLLVKYVEAGWLGRKTRRGFYDYHGEGPSPPRGAATSRPGNLVSAQAIRYQAVTIACYAGPRARMSGTGARDCQPGQLPGSGAQRRLSAAELFPAVPVVLAGRDQGGVSRSRQHHRPLRRPRAQPLVGNGAAEGRLVEGRTRAR